MIMGGALLTVVITLLAAFYIIHEVWILAILLFAWALVRALTHGMKENRPPNGSR